MSTRKRKQEEEELVALPSDESEEEEEYQSSEAEDDIEDDEEDEEDEEEDEEDAEDGQDEEPVADKAPPSKKRKTAATSGPAEVANGKENGHRNGEEGHGVDDEFNDKEEDELPADEAAEEDDLEELPSKAKTKAGGTTADTDKAEKGVAAGGDDEED